MSKWRETYDVHPAADVFPMMSDEELDVLGEDIKAKGLVYPPVFTHDGTELLDGRNRLEAAERVGVPIPVKGHGLLAQGVDPTAFIISMNIRRRHLTKAQQADLIVAAVKAGAEYKPRQDGEVSKGGRGKKDETKAAIVATAAEHGISKRTVERAIAKDEGKEPAPKKTNGIAAARRHYHECFAELDREAMGRELERLTKPLAKMMEEAREEWLQKERVA